MSRALDALGVFPLEDGRALVLPEGAPHATIGAPQWAGASSEGRASIIGHLRQSLKAAEAARRAEEDPRIDILRTAAIDARRLAMELQNMLTLSMGFDHARVIFDRLEAALDRAGKIERGR